MMKFINSIFILVLICSVAQAKDLQLFNPDVLGQSTSNAIKLLYDKKPDEIEPIMVTTDIKCGKYLAASVFYSQKVSFAEAREILNKVYRGNETTSLLKESKQALWRVDDQRVAIHLVQEEGGLRIMYLRFQSTKEVFKDIMKSTGADMDDNECRERQGDSP